MQTRCDRCQQIYAVSKEFLGKEMTCSRCGARFIVKPLSKASARDYIYVIAGFVCRLIILLLLANRMSRTGVVFESATNERALVVGGGFLCVYFVFKLLYLLVVYPSYFSQKQMLKEEEEICFFNLFFGGLIIGSQLQKNFNEKKKGISHIVGAVLAIIYAALFLG